MQGQTLVAVYRSREEAEKARDDLRALGLSDSDIRLSADRAPELDDLHIGPAGGRDDHANPLAPRREEGFFDWLFDSGAPESDRDWYRSNLREGRTAVSVRLGSSPAASEQRILDTLEAHDPIDIDEEGAAATAAPAAETPVPQTGIAGSTVGTSQSFDRLPGAAPASEPASSVEGEEEVIPVVEEELQIGKRVVEKRHRVRAYVVEQPVEERVNLRDERVVVERRPVSGDRAAAASPEGGDGLREREFEVIERHEEPIVEKTARAVEEVVVHTDVRERAERVRDRVRRTRVEVDKAAAGNKPSRARRGGGSDMPEANPDPTRGGDPKRKA